MLVGALVVLLGMAWLAGVFERNPSNIKVPSVDIPFDEVQALTVKLPEDTLEMELQNGRWMIRRPVDSKADSATVARFLLELSDMTLDTRATSNPDRYSVYGMDSTASTITLQWAEGTEEIVISRQGRDYLSIYARVGEDPTVYSTNGRVTVTQDISRWRDRLMTRINPASVRLVRVARPDDSYEVALSDGTWMINDAPGDSLQVANWLRRFNPLNADGFFDDIPPQILTDSSYRIEITMTTGATTALHGLPYESALAMTVSGARFTYRVYESRLDQLFPSLESLTQD